MSSNKVLISKLIDIQRYIGNKVLELRQEDREKKCKHPRRKKVHDPSGGSDSHWVCAVCGKVASTEKGLLTEATK